tara:strand:- start:2554 stop:2898 length:345 start_codon:yes stop_codon:yes gene_type:complete
VDIKDQVIMAAFEDELEKIASKVSTLMGMKLQGQSRKALRLENLRALKGSATPSGPSRFGLAPASKRTLKPERATPLSSPVKRMKVKKRIASIVSPANRRKAKLRSLIPSFLKK